jgi:hypothetical protein
VNYSRCLESNCFVAWDILVVRVVNFWLALRSVMAVLEVHKWRFVVYVRGEVWGKNITVLNENYWPCMGYFSGGCRGKLVKKLVIK